jgi:RNA polymerase sigma-70 factor (ECF subfamily)
MPEPNRTELITQAAQGHVHAFREVVNLYQSFAYSVSYRFLGNAEDAEDVTQEAFIRLWKNLHHYKPEVKLTTWLYRIIANLCLDVLKSSHHKQQRKSIDVKAEWNMTHHQSSDAAVQAQELHAIIQEAASELTPKQKAVFILRDLEELPVEEVCSILSMSAGNVKSNLYYARLQMSEKLKKYYQTTDKITTL